MPAGGALAMARISPPSVDASVQPPNAAIPTPNEQWGYSGNGRDAVLEATLRHVDAAPKQPLASRNVVSPLRAYGIRSRFWIRHACRVPRQAYLLPITPSPLPALSCWTLQHSLTTWRPIACAPPLDKSYVDLEVLTN